MANPTLFFAIALALLICCTLTHSVCAIRETTEIQRTLIQDLYRLMPNLVTPTLPLSQLLQQRANVRFITYDVRFQNIECARDKREHLLCGIYVTYHEMHTDGWVDALWDTIDAVDDALSWRGYTFQDFFIEYDKSHLVTAPEAARASCSFERGVPIYTEDHITSLPSLSYALASWDGIFQWTSAAWGWSARRYHCARYYTEDAVSPVWSHIQEFALPYFNFAWWNRLYLDTKPASSNSHDSSRQQPDVHQRSDNAPIVDDIQLAKRDKRAARAEARRSNTARSRAEIL